MSQRDKKIERFKQKSELKSKIQVFNSKAESEKDEEVLKQFYVDLIKYYVITR